MPETNKHIGVRVANKILELVAQGKEIPEIAVILKLPTGKVWSVARGITWKEAQGKRRGKTYGEVTRDKAQRLIRLREKYKAPVSKLAESSGLSETTVREILKGVWRDIWDRRNQKKDG